MTLNELGSILREMYQSAPEGDRVAMIHLFSIKHASAISELDGSYKDVAVAAGINES